VKQGPLLPANRRPVMSSIFCFGGMDNTPYRTNAANRPVAIKSAMRVKS